jgi:hypothetical protein
VGVDVAVAVGGRRVSVGSGVVVAVGGRRVSVGTGVAVAVGGAGVGVGGTGVLVGGTGVTVGGTDVSALSCVCLGRVGSARRVGGAVVAIGGTAVGCFLSASVSTTAILVAVGDTGAAVEPPGPHPAIRITSIIKVIVLA